MVENMLKRRYQYTASVDFNNTHYKRIQSLIQNHMPLCAVSLLESREQRYIKAMNNNDISSDVQVSQPTTTQSGKVVSWSCNLPKKVSSASELFLLVSVTNQSNLESCLLSFSAWLCCPYKWPFFFGVGWGRGVPDYHISIKMTREFV